MRSPSKVWLRRTLTLTSDTEPASATTIVDSATPRSGSGTLMSPLLTVEVWEIGFKLPRVKV